MEKDRFHISQQSKRYLLAFKRFSYHPKTLNKSWYQILCVKKSQSFFIYGGYIGSLPFVLNSLVRGKQRGQQ